jgi:hypothetical protein
VPNPLTSFVGRDRDVTGVRKNLAAGRLVTLTGPGGVGKTRLAAEACGSLDAIASFVALAPVTDPSEAPSTRAASTLRGLGKPRAANSARRPSRPPTSAAALSPTTKRPLWPPPRSRARSKPCYVGSAAGSSCADLGIHRVTAA